MLGRADQHRVEGIDRGVGQVGGHVQHRTHGQVDAVRAQQAQAVLAGDVVQHQLHLRMLGPEGLHQGRQQVEDGRAAGRDVQFAGLQALEPAAEFAVQPVQALDQGAGQVVQHLAFAGQAETPADALEQGLAQLPLQGLQLQGHGRLAEEQGLGRPRHRAQARDLAEGPKRLQPVALVIKTGRGSGHKPLFLKLYKLV